MERLFETSKSRRPINLDGVWRFITDKNDKGEALGYPNGLPKEAIPMPVPSMWNNTLGLFHYEGTAWYETDIITKSSSIALTFEAVHNECEIYLDGNKIGYHYGGWNEFKIYVDNVFIGKHKLVLRVNNSLNIKPEKGATVSVFSLSEESRGVTLGGLYYPLRDAILRADTPLGVSNSALGEEATVSVKEGALLVMWEY